MYEYGEDMVDRELKLCVRLSGTDNDNDDQ